MRERLVAFGGEGEPLLFAHANGYPVGSYRCFLQALAGGCAVTGVQQRPLWTEQSPPARLDWQGLATDLVETIEQACSGRAWVAGHSMGAAVATLAAARRPDLFRGLVLIEPVFFERRRVLAQRLMPLWQLNRQPMVRKALARPNRFASPAEAYEFHRGKRAFREISDEVLWDYIRAGTRPRDEGGVELVYSRDWEAAAYRSSPWVWPQLARITLPVLGLRGKFSTTLTPRAFARWASVQPAAELRELEGGHLLPLERPERTAREVLGWLAQVAARGGN